MERSRSSGGRMQCVVLLALVAVLSSSWAVARAGRGEGSGDPRAQGPDAPADLDPAVRDGDGTLAQPRHLTVSVRPAPIDDVLYNPGMGFVDSHFAYGYEYPEDTFISYNDYRNPPPYPDPDEYPPSKVAYFRWCWSAVEPEEGKVDFDRFDTIIAHAAQRSEGERLGFRILTIEEPGCVPGWLTSKRGYRGSDRGLHVPDYSNPIFVAALGRLLKALGGRYDGHPGIDHIDIGAVGCWGEWNTACLDTDEDLCQIAGLTPDRCLAAFKRIIDIHRSAFRRTPTLMLGKFDGVLGQAMSYALQRGTGWRVDCLGDWGRFTPDWNHHEDEYPYVVALAGDAWKRGPVHLEICGVFPDWYETYHMSLELVQQTFDWALENHASVINGKSTGIPPAYASIVAEFQKKLGYRLSIEEATHAAQIRAGRAFRVHTHWKNAGVAPPYLRHTLAFRLRDRDDRVVLKRTSAADIRKWLPGQYVLTDTFALPWNFRDGTYALEVALLGPDGKPAIALANEGRRADGWYELSQVAVVAP